ncbi:uncharacterized protein IL334_005892 [Kwoniella shivajii]|uniref:Uncharacterized protein n=1 Tax=Kwoniella shivajii TaxID=564305 RepID=A0ABZ1D4S7_9TREE|nr:hypothetical protein IL334_005892 [Kwoniella shivajii]
MPPRSPRRQQSTLSSASSGARTVRPRSQSRSLSRQHSRLTNPEQLDDCTQGAYGDTAVDVSHTDTLEDIASHDPGTRVETDAGPSDYWKRQSKSPSQVIPIDWRKLSDKPFNLDEAEDGPSDQYWPDSPRTAPPPSHQPAACDDGPDNAEYGRRLHDVMAQDSPPSDSPTINVNAHDWELGGYQTNYQDIIGDAENSTSPGFHDDEEFGNLNLREVQDRVSNGTPSIVSTRTTQIPLISPSPGKRTSFILQQPQLAHLRTSSHFSQISEAKSETMSVASASSQLQPLQSTNLNPQQNQSPAYTFHPLRRLSAHLFLKQANATTSPLKLDSKDIFGKPTVMDVRGMVAVGTDHGFVLVYTFGQELKHVLGNDGTSECSLI